MGLTAEQKLYTLPDYYMLLIIGDNDIIGLIDEETRNEIDECELESIGFYLQKVNFDDLYTTAFNILKEEGLI